MRLSFFFDQPENKVALFEKAPLVSLTAYIAFQAGGRLLSL
jgi:hypothetical protein